MTNNKLNVTQITHHISVATTQHPESELTTFLDDILIIVIIFIVLQISLTEPS